MKILLKNTTILDADSAYFKQQKDILISNGKIKKVADKIEDNNAEIVKSKDLHISQSWVDLKADFCDPGMEVKETINSGLAVAANGGFGHVFLVPTTSPVIDNKGQVSYLINKNKSSITQLHPIGAITKGIRGEELSEMYDLYQSGVNVFSDNNSVLSSKLLCCALRYIQNFGGLIVSSPYGNTWRKSGQVNEGIASLQTGLKPLPAVEEIIQIQRDLSLVDYTDSQLHISGISLAKSVQLIREAKRKKSKVSCDVHLHQLLFNELSVVNYDTNFKVYPPYRKEEDRKALWEGIVDGTIDLIVSNHQPQNREDKDTVFDHACFGNISLQNFYSVLMGEFPKYQPSFISKISSQPRKIIPFDENTSINVGNTVDCTLFDPSINWCFDANSNLSKSTNSPFFGKQLKGKAVGIIKKDRFHKI